MGPAGLLSLPVEVLHRISKYLTAEDILSVSQTCYYLRAAFNDDSVWVKFVPNPIKQLKSREPLVEPKFSRRDGFISPCDSLTQYMMKYHLINNWKELNFFKCSTNTDHWFSSGVFNVPKGRKQIIYQDRYIFFGRFTNDFESDGIEVWDIAKEPVVHSFLPIQNKNYECFYIIGCNLVIVECRIVTVYQITVPERGFPLLYSFTITESDATLNGLVGHYGRCDLRCCGWSFNNVNEYLVSNKCGDEGNVFHIWDIFNASKVGAYVTPIPGFSVKVLCFEGNNWLLNERKVSGNEQFCFFFNVVEGTFSDVVFKYEEYAHHLIYYKSHIVMFKQAEEPNSAGWFDSLCLVYDFKTSKEIKRRKFNNARKNHNISATSIVDGTFIILCFDCFQIIDAITLETVDHFQCDLDVKFITHQFSFFNSLFIVAAGGNNLLYVWDVKKKKKLPRSLGVGYGSHLYLSESFSKLVASNYYFISVFHFW